MFVLSKKDSDAQASVKRRPENETLDEAYRYGKAAVAADSKICSEVCYNYNELRGFRFTPYESNLNKNH